MAVGVENAVCDLVVDRAFVDARSLPFLPGSADAYSGEPGERNAFQRVLSPQATGARYQGSWDDGGPPPLPPLFRLA